MLVLDTNHLSELTFGTAAGKRLLSGLEDYVGDISITAITVEEGMRGWLAEIRRQTIPRNQIWAYQRLVRPS